MSPLFTRLARRGAQFAAHCNVQAAVHTVASARGLPVDAVCGAAGSTAPRGAMIARQEAIYLTSVHFNQSLRRIGDVVGLSQEGVRKALATVEGRRDDIAYDRRLDELELELMETA